VYCKSRLNRDEHLAQGKIELLKENLTDLKKRTITISLDKQVILVSGCIDLFSPTSSASFLLREEKEPSKLLSPSDLLITGASYDIPSCYLHPLLSYT